MSRDLCLSFGEYFVEASLKKTDGIKSSRWLAGKGSLGKNLGEFLQSADHETATGVASLDRLHLYFPILSSIITKNRGATPAFLTTVGFENWLESNLPRQSFEFCQNPHRIQSPLDRNLCFGISERMNAQGESLKSFDPEEIDFLASKLKLNDVEWVAIGLLHSDKNNRHEEAIADRLQQQGFKTICSSKFSAGSELERWWLAVIGASLGPVISSKIKELEETLNQLNLKPEVFFGTDKGLLPGDVLSRGVELLKGPGHLLETWTKKQGYQATLWSDLEGFSLSSPLNGGRAGLPGMSHWGLNRLQLQPLSSIVPHWLGDIDILGQEISFEPGPMALGKGLKPCFLDCLTLLDRRLVEGYSHLVVDRALTRLQENIAVLARGLALKEHRSHAQWTERFVHLGLQQLQREVLMNTDESLKQISVVGALEGYFYQPFKSFFESQGVKVKMGPPFLSQIGLEPV